MKKFVIKTLGCKTNQVESALIAEILTKKGYEEIKDISSADYYILNNHGKEETIERLKEILEEL